ncbi:hypothetical protein K458DRAFT_479138 [Lentithecium fluviatile CBS 122367]|uniref:Uncharacterized protein n=1 Tax=Lentithecium fluviatile CBS 122367 TaxID=1168545 RepID=A0A6G1IUK2_9PLEO|nr:hypothetical protein K458DRAFT_479138 [Lentithecium fluviatile CBS 122367]
MLLGRSFLFPTTPTRRHSRGLRGDKTASDIPTLLGMTGLIGLVSTLMVRRSYVSFPQLFFFICAAAVVWVGEKLDSGLLHDQRGFYQALPCDSAIIPTNRGETARPEPYSDAKHVAELDGHRKSYRHLATFVVTIGVLALWIPFMALNFSERSFQKIASVPSVMDHEYTPQVPVDVVINMYQEPVHKVVLLVSRLKALPNLGEDLRIHIYVKDNETDIDRARVDIGADEITQLQNVGREGQTFLYHILNHWDTLAKHTIFLQADVHNPREFYPRIRDYFDPARTGMLSLGWSGQVCNCNECGDRFGFWDTTHLFPQVYNRVYNSTKCGEVLLSYKGQFIASAKRIQGVDISVYRDLHDAFVNETSWAHDEAYLQGRPDSMSAPLFGYTMERMWDLLFQCNSIDVAWKCPTLLSGGRIGGDIGDCQCFDSYPGSMYKERRI